MQKLFHSITLVNLFFSVIAIAVVAGTFVVPVVYFFAFGRPSELASTVWLLLSTCLILVAIGRAMSRQGLRDYKIQVDESGGAKHVSVRHLPTNLEKTRMVSADESTADTSIALLKELMSEVGEEFPRDVSDDSNPTDAP